MAAPSKAFRRCQVRQVILGTGYLLDLHASISATEAGGFDTGQGKGYATNAVLDEKKNIIRWAEGRNRPLKDQRCFGPL
jgi:hypothetical protein